MLILTLPGGRSGAPGPDLVAGHPSPHSLTLLTFFLLLSLLSLSLRSPCGELFHLPPPSVPVNPFHQCEMEPTNPELLVQKDQSSDLASDMLLCDRGQVTQSLWAALSSFVAQVK